MTMSMATLIETAVQQQRALEVERVAKRARDAEIVEASKAADLAELRALLGEGVADQMEIALVSYDLEWNGQVYNTRYRLKPRAWNGLVSFDIYRQYREQVWRFIYEDRHLRDEYVDAGVEPDQLWARPGILAMLAQLQARYEQARDNGIALALARLSEDENVNDPDAADAHAELLRLAPERAVEWDAALAKWQQSRDGRQVAFDAYVGALRVWRSDYEAALAHNRATVAAAQQQLNNQFSRYEIAYAAVGDDADEPYVERVWAALPAADVYEYWLLYEGGCVIRRRLLRPMWVGEEAFQKLDEAGAGPWRNAIYVHDAGVSLYCLPWDEERAREMLLSIAPLPGEPTPPEWVRDGLTADEHRRINEVVGGMARADIPF